MVAQFTLYTRHGCHLCEDMQQALAPLATELGFTINSIDIEGDTGLETKYGTRVPVLLLGERLIADTFLDPTALKQALSEYVDD